jgi:histidine triad (HIT) family protein/ATP adenylyltransferase
MPVPDESNVESSRVPWDVAPLPPGVPYERQQYHALMGEHGLIPWSPDQAADLAGRLRQELQDQGFA